MADLLEKIWSLGKKRKHERDSSYSMVSCSEVTPGSLEVWVELPDEIKFDPSLAPFKQLYEQQHGRLEKPDIAQDGDKTIFNKKIDGSNHVRENKDNGSDTNINNGGQRLISEVIDEEKKLKSTSSKQLKRSLRIIKLSVLVACWGLLTVSLLLNKEQSDVVLHTAAKPGEIKELELHNTSDEVSLLVTLSGPFSQANNSLNKLVVWLHRSLVTNSSNGFEQDSAFWTIHLPQEQVMDFAPSATETKRLTLENPGSDPIALKRNYDFRADTKMALRLRTTGNTTVPLTLSYRLNPISERDGIIYAISLLATLYALIIFEIVNRTIAALLCSSLSIAVLSITGSRPSLPELMSWLDVETLLLLFSMMILVAILAETGLFDYLAVVAFELTKGKTWPLINCLCLFTALFSTFLDNVTTVLLMTPVTIRLCEVLELNPVPVLISMVIFSNVGGAATPVGDPPNVIIASHPSILSQNINFTTFTLHMGLGIILICIQTYLQLRFMFRNINTLRHTIPKHIQEMQHEIFVWKRAAASLSSYSRDEDLVRKALEKKVERLKTALLKKELGGGKKNDPKFCTTLTQMKEKYKIRDKELLIKSTICVSFVVVVFFLHAIPQLQSLSLGWTALLGALLLLLLAERDDLEPVLARVEWSTLLFFAALFVLMESLSKLGLISCIGSLTEGLILKVNEDSRLLVAIMLVLWVSGLASAFVDNIPLTTMMIRIVASLGDPKGLGLPLAPLAWALSFGACLGGNGTLIGASANVVCAGVAEQHGYRFTFLQFLKIGFPVMIGNLVIASVYLLFSHCVFHWH